MNRAKSLLPIFVASIIANFFNVVYAQAAKQKQDQTLKLRSELVQFDVLVTGKDDHPVRNLTKDDFVLTDNGKPQDISFFSLVDVAAEAAESGYSNTDATRTTSPIDPDAGRTIFLILDPYFIAPDTYPALKKSLTRLINEDLLGGDQVALISTSGDMPVFQQATRNKLALLWGVDRLMETLAHYSLLKPDGSGLLPYVEPQYAQAKQLDTLRLLTTVVKSASDVPGRKIAFFFSSYFTMRTADPASAFTNLFWELEQITSKSRKGGLTFYTQDPRGLVVAVPGGSAAGTEGASAMSTASSVADPRASADALLEAQEGIRVLAAETGGYAILNNNDLHAGLERVMNQNSSYYVLAYYPSDLPDKEEFRKVKIEVKGHPALRVYTRAGYLWIGRAEGPENAAKTPKQQRVSQALAAVVPIRDLRVKILQPSVVKDEKTGEMIARMVVDIDPRTWPFKVDGEDHLASFEVVAFAYDLKNKLVDGYSKEYSVRLKPSSFSVVMKQGMNLHGEIRLTKPGLYSLRVVVIDKETGRLGSAVEWVMAK